MQSVTELIVRVADLCEAEGRVLRSMAVRIALSTAAILVAAVMVTGGAGLVLRAVYVVLEAQGGIAIAALVTGLIAVGIGGALAWLGRRIGA